MNPDPLERLREADPVPGGGSAPDFASVMSVIRATGEPAGGQEPRRPDDRPHPRVRWLHGLRPALGVAAALAVVAAVLLLAGRHARTDGGVTTPSPPTRTPAAHLPPPLSLMPRHGGMIGLVTTATPSGSGSALAELFAQCATCGTHFTAHGQAVNWTARSTDEGRHWRVARMGGGSDLEVGTTPAQSGQNIWAEGTVGPTQQAFLVSHDGGRSFAAVPAIAGVIPSSESAVTIDDGTVWGFASRCDDGRCHGVVLSGPVGGDRLAPTATQPALRPHHDAVNATISAHGSSVYVTSDDASSGLQTFASHDGGRSWSQVTYPCHSPIEGSVTATGARTLWAVCLAGQSKVISLHSADGGHHWTTTGHLTIDEKSVFVVSGQVAWASGQDGTIERTDDGGRTWQTVLHVPITGGQLPLLSVQSASTATIAGTVTRGSVAGHDRRTDLVVDRTTDGGEHWTSTVIHLPAG